MEETSDPFQDLKGQPDQPRPIINNEVSDENHGQHEPGGSSEYSDTDDEEDDEEVHGDSNQDLVKTYEQQAKEFKDQATHIKAQLDRQMDTFASQSLDYDNGDARNRFYRQFRHDMAPPKVQILKHLSVWQWNILYYIADEKQSDRPCDWLVGRLAKDFPSLLNERMPNGGLTVLLKAVKEHNFAFIKAVIDSGISTTDLAKIIVERDVDKKNCIHYAVADGFDPEIAIQLLQHTTEETLGHQDNKGLTPLHYAVEYERCLPEREEMVKALIKRSDAAFDLRSGKPEELSVYQHHVRSREKYGKKKELRRMERERKEKEKQNRDSKEKSGDAPAGRHETGPMSRKDEAKNSKRMGEQPNRIGFKMREGADSQVPGELEPNSMDALQLLAGSKRDARDQNQFGRPLTRTRTGSQKPPNPKKVSSRKRPKLPKPSEDVADRILKELKLYYLRTALCQENRWQYGERLSRRNPNTAIQFLYGDNEQETQIGFEFPPKIPKTPNAINFRDFTKSYESLKFDKVLQHVEFRQMTVKSPPVKRPDWTDSEGRAGAGRKDVYYFFRWLSKKKSVENIIHLIVEDGHSISHSDEAIEESLKDFNIEILDWRKPDLDPMTLQSACRNSDLREVHLWWDGNNAVLRAWSEPDGLFKITTLQIIHLHETKKNIESSHRTKARIESFKTRIREHRAKVLQPLECHHYEPYEQHTSRPQGQMPTEQTEQRARIDPYQWLSVMDRFSDGIASLEPLECFPGEDEYLKHPSLPAELRKDVKVALIDDGVNFMHKSLAENMDGGKSFDREYDDGYRPGPREPFHGSATGHGTCMAYMIRRVCPRVKIFGCRLNVLRGNVDGKASFTAKSAADAVEYAVARKFDIISISWTVQLQKDEKHDNSADISRLENAISLATATGILVFCSAPDIGRASKETLESYYPFGCKRSSTDLFKIGAAKADGVSFAWMGHEETVNYILPGHKVAPREADNLPEEDDTPKTGSSVATALASGLAALIIHCVRLAAIYNIYTNKRDDLSVNETKFRAIKRFPAMKEALAILCSNNDEKQTRDRNLRVENFFKRPGDTMDNKDISEEEKWKQVVNIARDLVSYKTLTQTTI
ncbi:hypothetical protein HYE68_002983 [Fusarium pseudograminearum]|nr:hypothetical protein HYE68_002983 [Fusarium pseudograminearum]